MAYYLYTLTFLFLLTATVLYFTRPLWLPHAPPIPYLTSPGYIPAPLYDAYDTLMNRLTSARYSSLPTSFAGDAEAGLHSSNFDLSGNIEAEDGRAGLDEGAKKEVFIVMKRRGVGFDEARRIRVEERFAREGVGRDGRPLDKRAVMFS
nr:hypothetical protein B0A51_15544 [Rachicladosporium sp. CCFEE 5018]